MIEYLTRQLGRNPIHESGEIVRSRAKAFKLERKSTTPAQSTLPSGQRQKVRDELERIREQCFTGPVEPMLRSLATMPLADYPDLAVLAYRLQVILDSRAKLPSLSQHPQFDGDFFSVLKQVLISPARDVAVLREQVLASFRIRRNRKRGQAMIKLIESEIPGLFALEADWLRSLARYRGVKYLWGGSQSEKAFTDSSSGAGWMIWILVILSGVAIRSCARSERENGSPPRNRAIVVEPARPVSPELRRQQAEEARQRSAATQEEWRQRRERIDREWKDREDEWDRREREDELKRREEFVRDLPASSRKFFEDAWREEDERMERRRN